jgi:hypothetical protein
VSTEPGAQVGQLSPDGLWRWDGSQWVATAPGFAPTPGPQRSRSWIWWLVGGCAVLLVIGLVGGGFGLYSLVQRFQHGGFSCLPSDFPSYPGASVVSENTKVGTGAQCNMVYDSNDDVATVTTYYQAHLNSGDWTIVSSDSTNGAISFQRKSSSQTTGTVTLVGRGQHSEIDIQLDN